MRSRHLECREVWTNKENKVWKERAESGVEMKVWKRSRRLNFVIYITVEQLKWKSFDGRKTVPLEVLEHISVVIPWNVLFHMEKILAYVSTHKTRHFLLV